MDPRKPDTLFAVGLLPEDILPWRRPTRAYPDKDGKYVKTVLPPPAADVEKVAPILAGLRPLFDRHSGVMFVTDVSVSRQEYFGKTPK